MHIFWYLFGAFLLVGSLTFIKEEKQELALVIGLMYFIAATIYSKLNEIQDKIK